jgi:predicted RNase H-like nuclease (RuvC/YqgF family)
VEDFDRLYRLLHSQYKDFHKRHRSSEHTIQGLEGEIKSLCSRIEQLEGEIEELKVLDDEELKKLAKMEEVQVLEANMHVLERQLDFERGQWTELQGKYKELMDRFFVLDHLEGVSLANAIQKKLDKHLDEQFHQRVSMEVTKRVSNIMEDPELQKKLAYINVDEEYNNRVSKEAMKRFKDMEECLMLSGDPNVEITPSWLNGPSTQ